MKNKELVEKIINDLKRLEANTGGYVFNFIRFGAMTKPPFEKSFIEFDLDKSMFQYNAPKSLAPLTFKKYIKAKSNKNNCVRDGELIYYPKGANTILFVEHKADWIIELYKSLVYSNYSEAKKLRIIHEKSEIFYGWYKDTIEKELKIYRGILKEIVSPGTEKNLF